MTDWLIPPPVPAVLCVEHGRRFPVRNVWCVGRNYAEHAREMGADPDAPEPIFFAKPASALVSGPEISYPPRTTELHHEVELVVLLGRGGYELTPEAAAAAVLGYAVGVDLTRRDVQARAKSAGGPWALAKGFDASGPVGEARVADDWQPRPDTAIELHVNGDLRQSARLGDMLRSAPELIAALSRDVALAAGDVIFTGTPAGVGPLSAGDTVNASIRGLQPLQFTVTT